MADRPTAHLNLIKRSRAKRIFFDAQERVRGLLQWLILLGHLVSLDDMVETAMAVADAGMAGEAPSPT
jgi:hypothetical protein